jgi:prevent-host-death family protein
MATVPFSEAREHFTDLVNEVAYGGKRIILTRKGKRLVAIVPLDDLETIEMMEDKIDIAAAKKAYADIKKHGTVSLAHVKKEFNK